MNLPFVNCNRPLLLKISLKKSMFDNYFENNKMLVNFDAVFRQIMLQFSNKSRLKEIFSPFDGTKLKSVVYLTFF